MTFFQFAGANVIHDQERCRMFGTVHPTRCLQCRSQYVTYICPSIFTRQSVCQAGHRVDHNGMIRSERSALNVETFALQLLCLGILALVGESIGKTGHNFQRDPVFRPQYHAPKVESFAEALLSFGEVTKIVSVGSEIVDSLYGFEVSWPKDTPLDLEHLAIYFLGFSSFPVVAQSSCKMAHRRKGVRMLRTENPLPNLHGFIEENL